MLPALVEVYVNSILVPNSKSPNENTNQPIDEEDIRRVFRDFVSQDYLLSTVSAFITLSHVFHIYFLFVQNVIIEM